VSNQQATEILQHLEMIGVKPRGITADSRRLRDGDIFAAWPGHVTDGRRFIAEAVVGGASAVLWDNEGGFDPGELPVPSLGIAELRTQAGFLADEIYGHPSQKLWMAGVTGTNGKTTVSQWLARTLTELGTKSGVIGTLGHGFPDQLNAGVNTTPDALEVHALLADFVAAGAAAAAMEVSSIGLEQGRVNGVRFDTAIFTNLSRDHLDYHGSIEAYAEAKARLFDLPGVRTAVINFDDAFGITLAQRLTQSGVQVIGYTCDSDRVPAVSNARVLAADDLRIVPSGLRFSPRWGDQVGDVQVRMVAPFNVSNLLAVIAALLAHGNAFNDALRIAARQVPPQGRMQLVGGVGEPLVIIDYAHSPDALSKVLQAVRSTAQTRGGGLVCVFGCGGDRDPGKRALMGGVAKRFADKVLITSDNPRSEDPMKIIDDILEGAGAGVDYLVDRGEAIARAIGNADADDVIVIAGKGHEDYQEIDGKRLPFSDLEHARQALQVWDGGKGAGA